MVESNGDMQDRVIACQIREATVDLALAEGYEGTGVEAVIARAGVEPADFDRLFSGKQDLFLKTYEAIAGAFEEEVFEAFAAYGSWRDSLRAAAYTAARHFRDHPREVRFGIVQMTAVGDCAASYRDARLQAMVDLIDLGRNELDDPDSLTRSTAETALGSVYVALAKRLQQGQGAETAEDFVPDLMYIAVRPYFGQEIAEEELTIPAPAEPTSES